MGCGSSKSSVTSNQVQNRMVTRPKFDFKPENLQFYFLYEFNDGVDQATKEKVFALFHNLNEYFKTKGAYGSILIQLTFSRLENGWEAKEVFTDGSVYAKHVENFMGSPYFGELMGYQEHFTEKEAWLRGLETEFAKAPQIAEFYPTQKRIHEPVNLKADPRMHIGFMNQYNGDDGVMKGGSIVAEFSMKWKDPATARPIVRQIMSDLIKFMKEGNYHGTAYSHLMFLENEAGDGHTVVEIMNSAEFYERFFKAIKEAGFMKKVGEMFGMCQVEHAVLYGRKAEIHSSPMMVNNFKFCKHIYGTPNVEGWGPSRFGWLN